MPTTIAELLTVRSKDDVIRSLLATLAAESFPVTDWFSGGAGLTLTQALGFELADMSTLVPLLVQGGYVHMAKDLPDPTWMDLLAEQFFETSRAPATYTIQRMRAACLAGLGPQTIQQGFTVRSLATDRRYTYEGTAPVVVPDGGNVQFDVRAEAPGSDYDDKTGTITDMVTPLPGLSVLNVGQPFGGLVSGQARRNAANQGGGAVTPSAPDLTPPVQTRFYRILVTGSGQAGTSGSLAIFQEHAGAVSFVPVALPSPIPATFAGLGDNITLTFANGPGVGFVKGDEFTFQTPGTSIIANGVDEESNAELAKRMVGQWASLSANVTADKYRFWVRRASIDQALGIEKIEPKPSNTIAGQTDIIIATATGVVAPATVTAIQNYLDVRDGVTDSATVVSAAPANVSISGTVTVRGTDLDAVRAKADAAWADYIAQLPIGGDTSTGSPGVVRLAELEEAVMAAGAIDKLGLELNGVAANLALATDEVAVIPPGQEPSAALSWIAVS